MSVMFCSSIVSWFERPQDYWAALYLVVSTYASTIPEVGDRYWVRACCRFMSNIHQREQRDCGASVGMPLFTFVVQSHQILALDLFPSLNASPMPYLVTAIPQYMSRHQFLAPVPLNSKTGLLVPFAILITTSTREGGSRPSCCEGR
jgi:hypothetical protein